MSDQISALFIFLLTRLNQQIINGMKIDALGDISLWRDFLSPWEAQCRGWFSYIYTSNTFYPYVSSTVDAPGWNNSTSTNLFDLWMD